MGIGLIYLSNLFIPIFEIDAAQYAEMSREMLQSSNWLYLYDSGLEYLDKPPFLFWVSAFSMKIFGVYTWAYKLPSLLFAIWSIYALFKFAKLFYTKETAHTTALIYASCQAMFLITNDIKTDTILMSFTITAFWQLASWLYSNNKTGWIWGAICIGGAMITKGPIGLLIIGFGFLPHFIIKKQWKHMLRWQYIPMLAIIALVLLPMSIGLYQQFDLHPEKIVNGKQGVSGLKFFYWTQSFGRITGDSSWNNQTGFSFLYQNLLWGLIPFTIFFLASTITGLTKLVRKALQQEWISTFAVLLGYLALGMSKFQLPHYIYVVLPFICLLLGRYYVSIKNYYSHKYLILRNIHRFIFYPAVLILPILFYLIFPEMQWWQLTMLSLSYVAIILVMLKEKRRRITLLSSNILLVIILNVLLNFVFYLNLIPYQKEYTVATKIKELNIPIAEIGTYDSQLLRSADFLSRHNIPLLINERLDDFSYVVTSSKGLSQLDELNRPFEVLFEGERFPIGKLQIGFLKPSTRNLHTEKYFIVKLK